MQDPFGKAIFDYYRNGADTDIVVNSNYTESEHIPVSYFFRNKDEMPEIEKTALKYAKGKILDIGAAAGCHSLILQKNGCDITALEKSELAARVMQERGIQHVISKDILEYTGPVYDTLLLLMNGTGIGGTIAGFKKLLQHLRGLLAPNGQILIDSSDIKYLFEEEDGSVWMDLASTKYYGEMEYEVTYGDSSTSFNWLFADFDTLNAMAREIGFSCELIHKGKHFDYLARLVITV